MRHPFALRVAIAFLAFLLAGSAVALGNETDQFTLPAGREFVDLGSLLSQETYATLEKVVRETNHEIDRSLQSGDHDTVRRLQSAAHIASRVSGEYGIGIHYAGNLEDRLRSQAFVDRYPGKIVAYRAPKWIYSGGYLPIDPRQFATVLPSSTIKAYGVYFGTDKLGHFYQFGYTYYTKMSHDHSATPEEAAARAVRATTKGLISEATVLGTLSAGVFSNADLAANYAGMKFYSNLTEPTMVQGVLYPPMLVLRHERWALNDHIKPGAPIFAPFISEHFNEALNPSVYSPGLRGHVAKVVRNDATNILAFYADAQGRPRPQEYFESKLRELWTYYGEDYGHSAKEKKLVTIGNTCFASPGKSNPTEPVRNAKANEPIAPAKSARAEKAG